MRKTLRGTIVVALTGLATMTAAGAQETAEIFKGFGASSKAPINVDAATLEIVEEKNQRVSTFSGGVIVRRGDTVLNASTVKLYQPVSAPKPEATEDKDAGGGKAAKPERTAEEKAKRAAEKKAAAAPAKSAQGGFDRIEAIGNVKVTSGPQTVTGDKGVFDTKANTIVMTGRVVLTQGKNVINGTRLVVDLTTGKATVDQSGGRIKGVFIPDNDPLAPEKEKARKPEGQGKDKPAAPAP